MGYLALVLAGSCFLLLIASAIAVGLTYVTAALAFEKGRSQVAWAALSIATGGSAGALGAAIARFALDGDSPGTLALFTAFLPPILAGAGVVLVLAWLHRLGPRAAGGTRWPVYLLGNVAASGQGILELEENAICFRACDRPDVIVPLSAVVEARADGECVRLEHRAGDRDERIVFLPTRGPDDRAFRAHQSAWIAARIAAGPRASTARP